MPVKRHPPASPRAPRDWSPLALGAVAAALLAAGVHVVAILALPRVATRDAFHRVAAFAPLNAPFGALLGSPRAGGAAPALPFLDPSAVHAVCRYDLASGPLLLRMPVPDAPSSISFHARGGDAFASLGDRAATRGRLDVVLGTPAQIAAVAANDEDDTPAEEVRVRSPRSEGFALLTIVVPLPHRRPELEQAAAAFACGPLPPRS